MSRAFLFTNSSCPTFIKTIIKENDLIIGIDGGIDRLHNISLKPHILIGDFDSISADNPYYKDEFLKKIVHPPEKDYTDTELAVEYAINQGCDQIIIINDMQDRTDHALGVIASLRYLKYKNISALILAEKQILLFPKNYESFAIDIELEISLISYSSITTNITTTGLYYPLNNESLRGDRARGVSNVIKEKPFTISYESGEPLLIINFRHFRTVLSLF